MGVPGWFLNSKTMNMWTPRFYAKSLDFAIDHLISMARMKCGVAVDPARVGLVGHSMGGAGVLAGAGLDCRNKIKAVAALNPHFGFGYENLWDNVRSKFDKFLKEKPHTD